MIKVLHISTPATWRGGEHQVYNLAVMQQSGNEVKPVVVTPENSELSRRLVAGNLRVIGYPSAGFLKAKLAKTIAAICRTEKFDLVHTHDAHAHTAAVLAVSLFGMKVPVIVHRRVDFAVSGSFLSKWKYNHSSVKKIICVSEMIRTITAPSILQQDKLVVIYSGVDPQRYAQPVKYNVLRKELNIPGSTKLVGNLSALADHKDYPTFLKTAAILVGRHADIKFVIAGDGPERDNIRKLVQEMGLTGHVELLGFRQDVSAVMQSLDLFLMTSKTEGLGTILIEAFMAGVPVVASRAGGIPELIEHGHTGLLCPTGDENCFADAVERMIADADLRAKIIHRARTFATQFSHQNTADKTLSVYREVLQTHE